MKLKIFGVSVILIAAISFVLMINHIHKNQTIAPKIQETEDLSDYLTGETITLKDIYEDVGVNDATYYSAQFSEESGMDEDRCDIYYFYDKEILSEFENALKNTKFQKVGKRTDNLDRTSILDLSIGISEEQDILIYVSTTPWVGEYLCWFSSVKPGSFESYEEEFMFDSYLKGYLCDGAFIEALEKVVLEDVPDITLEDVEKIIQEKESITVLDFWTYHYMWMGYNEEGTCAYSKLPLKDGSGYLKIEYLLGRQNKDSIIYHIYRYNNKNQLQEVLYEGIKDEEE
jgi:hypothetical protein